MWPWWNNLEGKENDQSDDYISYTARRNMAELAVEHVWIKFRFHGAWGFGEGGQGTQRRCQVTEP
jgi:hypothetical protein